MRFKRVYIEITNKCNLRCMFCPPHRRAEREMKIPEFLRVLEQIKGYTQHIYLHVKGEPLMHTQIGDIIRTAYEQGFFINLTTNGTLLERHTELLPMIRQVNISLHDTWDESLLEEARRAGKHTMVSIRLWAGEREKLLPEIKRVFGICVELPAGTHTMRHRLTDTVFLSLAEEFEWPDIGAEPLHPSGRCYGLKHQIAVLADGTVTPCCLDQNGEIALGNIFIQSLGEILELQRARQIIRGFMNRNAVEELCRRCSYKNRF